MAFESVLKRDDLLSETILRWREGVPGSPGKREEGQEDHGTLKQLGGSPLALLHLLGPPGRPSSLGSLELPQATLR